MNIGKRFGEELQKFRKEMGRADVQLSSGRHSFGNGAYCDLRAARDGGFMIDRLFVPEECRGRGGHKIILMELVRLADEVGVALSMAVAPDRLKGEALDSPRYNKVTDSIAASAVALGFKPYRDGVDVYRLDLTYTPKNHGPEKLLSRRKVD